MQTITPICPSQYFHSEFYLFIFLCFPLQGINFFSECITWEKGSCQCVLPLLFGRSVKIVFNVMKTGNIKQNN